jgi:hypothetical protein
VRSVRSVKTALRLFACLPALAHPLPLGYDTRAMAPTGPISPDLFALADRLGQYNPWLHVVLALCEIRAAPSRPRGGGRRYVTWLLAEKDRIRRAGWFN